MTSINSSIHTNAKLARPLAVLLTLAISATACGANESDRAIVNVDASPEVITTTTTFDPPASSTSSSTPSTPAEQVDQEPVLLSPASAADNDVKFISPFPFKLDDFEARWDGFVVILEPMPLTAIENPPTVPLATGLSHRTWTLEAGPTITVVADDETGEIWVADITVSMSALDSDPALTEAFHRLLGLTQPASEVMAGLRLFGEALESPELRRTETMCFSLHGSEVDGEPGASLTIVSLDEPLCGAAS